MERSDQELLALGDFAKGLLTNDTFNVVFKEYSDLSLQAIVGSKPHETKLREFEYAKLQALVGFTDYLVGFAEAAQNLINKNDPTYQSDED
jgi:hypothetical protein